MTEQKGKLVLAYSGGLDTSISIRWLKDQGWDVVALTIDLGEKKDLDAVQERALKIGASAAYVVDGRRQFVEGFVWPSLQTGALYEKEYPLATAIGRPLIAALHGPDRQAGGCGGDRPRLHRQGQRPGPLRRDDGRAGARAPGGRAGPRVADEPRRRDRVRDAARHRGPGEHRLTVLDRREPVGSLVEAGILEDPWEEPPTEVWAWTRDADEAPSEPAYVEVAFQHGIPVRLDGDEMAAVDMSSASTRSAASTGSAAIDHIENRLIGIKSREIYEAPAAVLLLQAHQALEDITLTKDVARFKDTVAQQWAQMVYDGLWFSPLRDALYAFVLHTQRFVNGEVRLKLFKGTSQVVGRKSKDQLYQMQLATYGREDAFDQAASAGFIKLWGLGVRTASEVQGQLRGLDLAQLMGSGVKRLGK